jgi:hypothetical protein
MIGPGSYSTDPMGRMGEPPSGPLDYVVVSVAIVAVIVATVQAVRWLVRPREHAPDHIKRLVLSDDGGDKASAH